MSIWVPRCLDAARALQPLWSQPAEKVVTFATSLGHTENQFTTLLDSIDLETPKELDK
jgi:propane monooxygenase small subunit